MFQDVGVGVGGGDRVNQIPIHTPRQPTIHLLIELFVYFTIHPYVHIIWTISQPIFIAFDS